jgi:queuosine precursor transporter
MKKNFSTIAMISVASYIAAQMMADIASLKIALIGTLAIDAGTFIYPLTFGLRDLVHKTLGKQMARKLIITAGAINLVMALMFQFIVSLPADPSWPLQEAFASVINPLWRIVLASIIAEIVSELIDTEAYSYFVRKITKRYQWGRVLFSNALAIPVDSAIFVLIAFWGVLPAATVWALFLTNILVKGAVTLISLPIIYLTPDQHKDI